MSVCFAPLEKRCYFIFSFLVRSRVDLFPRYDVSDVCEQPGLSARARRWITCGMQAGTEGEGARSSQAARSWVTATGRWSGACMLCLQADQRQHAVVSLRLA